MGIVVVVALALRWSFVAVGDVVSPLRVDAGQYAKYAENLVEHGVYSLSAANPPAPDSFRSPGYPLLLSLCRLVGGDTHWHALALALQVALGTATVLLCYRLARSFLPFAAALGAAVACALSPHLVGSTTYVLTECATAFALTAGLTLLVGARSRTRVVAAGACLAFAVSCNETLVFVPFVVAWPLWRARGGAACVLCLAVALAPFGAWTLRNATTELARSGSERVTASISHGSYPAMVYRDPRLRGFPYREDPEQPAFGASWHDLGRVLGERVAAEPWRHVRWYLLEKPVWLWSWDIVQGHDAFVYEIANNLYDDQPIARATHTAMRWLHWPMMLLALAAVGAALFRARRGEASAATTAATMLAFVVVGCTLMHMLVIPDPRYMQPVRPLLFVLAAAAAAALAPVVGRVQQRRGLRPAAATLASDDR